MFDSIQSVIFEPCQSDASKVIAVTPNGVITQAEFEKKVALWQQDISSVDSNTIYLHHAQSDELLAGLLAIWRNNKIAVLSSDPHILGLEEKSKKERQTHVQGMRLPAAQVNTDTKLVLYTSGSNGKPKPISKTFSELDSELQVLESTWGGMIDDSVFVSTVSKHHMYGLPFALLWPFMRGNAFHSETIYYPQSLITLSQKFSITLISSPVHLDNLPTGLDWSVVQSQLKCLFSAGAPLPKRAALFCDKYLKTVIEIYGSTETGAVAWRNLLVNEYWRCLDGVTVECCAASQRLQISSPWLSKGKQNYNSSDRAKLAPPTNSGEHRFQLLGRVDRIAKVAGKRVSLTQIETILETHAFVTKVRVLQLQQRKSRLGAAVVLSKEGKKTLIDLGRGAFSRLLSECLISEIDRVAIPRYWRYISMLATDTQGKVSDKLLSKFFLYDQQPSLPELVSEQWVSAQEVCLVLQISESLTYFSGHFPGSPVLPGVVQIAWVQHFIKSYFPQAEDFNRIDRLKFQQVILPGNTVNLHLIWDNEKNSLRFFYESSGSPHSSGTIVYSSGNIRE